jgi:hypothetical protein
MVRKLSEKKEFNTSTTEMTSGPPLPPRKVTPLAYIIQKENSMKENPSSPLYLPPPKEITLLSQEAEVKNSSVSEIVFSEPESAT